MRSITYISLGDTRRRHAPCIDPCAVRKNTRARAPRRRRHASPPRSFFFQSARNINSPPSHTRTQQQPRQSKKRGLSLEEKRDRVLEVFHEAGDVFLLKDVEKIASKRGVVLQSIKEVLQSLVDDDLVHSEKIGISNYFW